MRVLIASHSAGLRGGAERCVLELAGALRTDGRVEPTVTVPMRGQLSRALDDAGVPWRVMRMPTWLVDTSPPWPRDAARGARRMKRAAVAARAVPEWVHLLRELRPDVVMTSTTVSPVLALASRRARIPHVWWIHEFTTRGLDRRYVLGEPVSQRLIGRWSRLVAVNSDAVRRHYSPPIDERKVRVVELGIESAPVRENCPSTGPLRLLMLGRKDAAKGCEDAIRAVADLAGSGDEVTLRMVGPSAPGYASTLWYTARDLGVLDRVEFLEYVEDPGEQLAWTNVVLMCTDGEAFGRVTVEALKSGRPVVGARGGATVELLDDGVNGLLYAPADVGALASAVRACARDRVLVEQMSKRALAGSAGRFTLQGELETFVDLFREASRT